MIEAFYWFKAGYCTAIEKLARRGGAWRKVQFAAAVGLFKHSQLGYILFDTGYALRYYTATQKMPARLVRWVLPTYVTEQEAVVNQLAAAGIQPTHLHSIILSHLHGDHVAGLADFAGVPTYLHETARPYLDLPASSPPKHGVIAGLLPAHLKNTIQLFATTAARPHPIFEQCWDFNNDGSLILVPLPGHALGQIGVIFSFEGREWLLAADAAWFIQDIEHQQMPPWLARQIIYDKMAYRQTLQKILHWQVEKPGRVVIPTHCPQSFARHYRPLHVV